MARGIMGAAMKRARISPAVCTTIPAPMLSWVLAFIFESGL